MMIMIGSIITINCGTNYRTGSDLRIVVFMEEEDDGSRRIEESSSMASSSKKNESDQIMMDDEQAGWLQLRIGSHSSTTTSDHHDQMKRDHHRRQEAELILMDPNPTLTTTQLANFSSSGGGGSSSYLHHNIRYINNSSQSSHLRPSTTTTPLDFRLIQPPTIRPNTGLWFMLKPSQYQEKAPSLPPLSKSYLRIKDGRITIDLVMKYLINKLSLENESVVEVRCRGQRLESTMTLLYVRDNIWSSPTNLVTLLPSTAAHHIMLLHYARSKCAFA